MPDHEIPDSIFRERLLGLLASKGIILANDAEPDEVLKAIDPWLRLRSSIVLANDAGPDEILNGLDRLIPKQPMAKAQEASPATPEFPAAPQPQPKKPMTSPLLGCDPREVSPARAGAAFSEFAKKLCTEQGIDLTQAWNRAKLLHPDVHARMIEKTPAEPALSNSTVPRTRKAFVAPAFKLPHTVDDDVLEAAWIANGSQSAHVDSQKTFLGISTLYMRKKGLSVSAARRAVQEDFPALARAAGQTPDKEAR